MSRPDIEQTADRRTRDELREQVRQAYAASARRITDNAGCCGGTSAEVGSEVGSVQSRCCSGTEPSFGSGLYTSDDLRELPDQAALASLGCGNPTAVAALEPGQTVLDLGSGGGIDVLLSARRVGPTGKAYGLDMTEEMLALARRNAAEAGATNVEFLKGTIEQIPLPADSVDVVISNCVINLSVDKPAVFAEIHRVLVAGGRIGISDVVADDRLSPTERADRGGYTECLAGALSFGEYHDGLAAVGFGDIEIEATHEVADGLHAAIVRAGKATSR